MDYNSFNTQWYELTENDVCEIDINAGSVTFRDKSLNTKSLRMDSETLVGSILMSLNDLVVLKDYKTYDEEKNYEILKCFQDTIVEFMKTSNDNKKKWEK